MKWLVFMIVLLFPTNLHPFDVGFTWKHSISRQVEPITYKIYCKEGSQLSGDPLSVEENTHITNDQNYGRVKDLEDDKGYWCAVTAVDQEGLESDWSNQIFVTKGIKELRSILNRGESSTIIGF